jgi:hypothetical protein
MKTDDALYKEIQKDIANGVAVVLRETITFDGIIKQQYIVRMFLDGINIMLWKYSDITSRWESKSMSWLQLDAQEIKTLQTFLLKFN